MFLGKTSYLLWSGLFITQANSGLSSCPSPICSRTTQQDNLHDRMPKGSPQPHQPGPSHHKENLEILARPNKESMSSGKFMAMRKVQGQWRKSIHRSNLMVAQQDSWEISLEVLVWINRTHDSAQHICSWAADPHSNSITQVDSKDPGLDLNMFLDLWAVDVGECHRWSWLGN